MLPLASQPHSDHGETPMQSARLPSHQHHRQTQPTNPTGEANWRGYYAQLGEANWRGYSAQLGVTSQRSRLPTAHRTPPQTVTRPEQHIHDCERIGKTCRRLIDQEMAYLLLCERLAPACRVANHCLKEAADRALCSGVIRLLTSLPAGRVLALQRGLNPLIDAAGIDRTLAVLGGDETPPTVLVVRVLAHPDLLRRVPVAVHKAGKIPHPCIIVWRWRRSGDESTRASRLCCVFQHPQLQPARWRDVLCFIIKPTFCNGKSGFLNRKSGFFH